VITVTFLLIMRGQSYLREALASFLRTEVSAMDLVTVGQAEEINTFPEESLAAIGLVLIHIGREPADSPSVTRVVESVRAQLNGTPMVLLGDLADDPQFRLALSIGTNGYIPTGTTADVFKHVLPIIAGGGVYAPPFVFASCPNREETMLADSRDIERREERTDNMPPKRADSFEAFTKREVEVLTLLGEGLPNKLIAHRLDLKEGTVKVHVRHIMNKLNVTSRTQAALFAQKHLSALIG
jgi:DNA-binding NarL/FixJ family response regulator